LVVESQDSIDQVSLDGKMSCLFVLMKYFFSQQLMILGTLTFLISYIMVHALGHMKSKEKRELHLKYAQYHLINSILFRKNYDGVLLEMLREK
jgi:NhaP-type Na+/H+ or K+/H+ antiporter